MIKYPVGEKQSPCKAGSELTDLSARLLLVCYRLLIFLVQQAHLADVFSQGTGMGRPRHRGAMQSSLAYNARGS